VVQVPGGISVQVAAVLVVAVEAVSVASVVALLEAAEQAEAGKKLFFSLFLIYYYSK
jgi:hypothetical protein